MTTGDACQAGDLKSCHVTLHHTGYGIDAHTLQAIDISEQTQIQIGRFYTVFFGGNIKGNVRPFFKFVLFLSNGRSCEPCATS